MTRRKHEPVNPLLSLFAIALVFAAWLFFSGDLDESIGAIMLGAICGGIILLLSSVLAFLQYKRRATWLREQQHIDQLLALTPAQFEERVAQLFRDMGHRADVIGGSGDEGVDIRVRTKSGKHWIVQCKRYAPENKIGVPVVRDLAGTMLHERATRAFLVTTSSFTEPAKRWAEKHRGLVLIDGHRLVRQIEKQNDTRK